MKKLILTALAAIWLGACTPATIATNAVTAAATAADTVGVAPPSTVADRTILDEKVGISVELAYKAWRVALETALDAKLVPASKAAQLAALDKKAYDATLIVQGAYATGNATSYRAAADEAIATLRQALALLRGK